MEKASRIRDWCIFIIISSFISQQVTSQGSICQSDTCLNGGICFELPNKFICSCPNGFLAPRCTKDLCDPNPCLNGGTCYMNDDMTEDYSCSCATGFTGKNCTNSDSICQFDTCLNGGICFELPDMFICSCPNGFLAPRCTKDLCVSNPCMNGGTCMNDGMTEDFSCSCSTGFTGKNCTDPGSPCESAPCLNNGVCFESSDMFICTCPNGFLEPRCTKDTNNGGISLWIVFVAVVIILLLVLAFVGLLWYCSRRQKGTTAHPDKQDNNGTDVRGNQPVNHHVNNEMVYNCDPKYYSIEDGKVKTPTYAFTISENR